MLNKHKDEIMKVMVKEEVFAKREQIKLRVKPKSYELMMLELRRYVGAKYNVADRHYNSASLADSIVKVGGRV
jgi:hypothetical protein